MKFAIGIPTLNRFDLLKPSLMLYLQRDFPGIDIYVADNGSQDIHTHLRYGNLKMILDVTDFPLPPKRYRSVAESWNIMCDEIFEKNDHVLMLNDDVYLGKNTAWIERLLSTKKNKGAFLRATPDWCAFLLSKRIYERVGKFDEVFTPAYYEDKDYEYRMKLAGIPIIKTPELNPFVYRSSQTLEKMPSLLTASEINKTRYAEKWGGLPGQEKFKSSYNK